MKKRISRTQKVTRLFDIFFSGIAISVLFPFMVPIVIGLKLTGEHYVFYEQERMGRGGKSFRLLKFATMLKDSPNMPGGYYTMKDDPRILPMGKFLRKTKINELPQLINILKGDMSVIGYRPLVNSEYKDYPERAKKTMSLTRPGLSGIGSIVFRNEEEILQELDDKDSFYRGTIMPYKAKLECWWIKNMSVILYFKLIIMTVGAVIHSNSKPWKYIKGLPAIPVELKEYL